MKYQGTEAKPCPFCGCRKTEFMVNTSPPGHRVRCDSKLGCGTLGPLADTKATAFRRWNVRPRESSPYREPGK